MISIAVKEDVRFHRFTPTLIRIISALDFIRMQGRTLVPGMPDELMITSAHDGKHMDGSRHYFDEAIDVRSHNFPNRACKDLFCHALRAHLGQMYTVLFEAEGTPNEHFHIQKVKGSPHD